MPRDGSGIYSVPPGSDGVTNATIVSAKYNSQIHDMETDLNTPRPIVAGGTGSNNPTGARAAMKAEVSAPGQIVTNYDSQVWESGSFSSAAGATGSPDGAGAATNAYLGTTIVDASGNIVVQARNLTTGVSYMRSKPVAGVWSAWALESGSGAFVAKSGDTMVGDLTISKVTPLLTFNRTSDSPAMVFGQRAGAMRWRMDIGDGGETGSGNAGGDFRLYRYSDAGALLGNPLIIRRATGSFEVEANPTAALGVATKQQIDALQTSVNGKVNRSGDIMTGNLELSGANRRFDIDDGVIEVRRPSQGSGYNALNGDGNPGMYSRPSNDGNMALAVLNSGGGQWSHAFYGNGNYTLTGWVTSNQSQFSTQAAITAVGGSGLLVNGNNGGGPAVKYIVQANWASMGYTVMGFTAVYNPGVNAYWQLDVGSVVFQFENSGQAYKSGGGAWAATSDARIKNVLGNYEAGLAEIRQLMPVRYTYKGNDTVEPPSSVPNLPGYEPTPTTEAPFANSPHYSPAVAGQEFIGLVAQDTEVSMPEMVSLTKGFIDGAEVTDLRRLDTTPLIFALVNAVKTLAARVEMLEAK